MLLAGFKPTISKGEGPQTYAFDRAVAETGSVNLLKPTGHVMHQQFNS